MLKQLYKKYEEIAKLKKELKEKEGEYEALLEKITAQYPDGTEEDDYVLIKKERVTRKVTNPRRFIEIVGDIGWPCLSVSIQKVDALKLQIPEDILERHIGVSYEIKKK